MIGFFEALASLGGLTLDTSTFHVMIVDDFERWRFFTRSLLSTHSDWVLSEACDGPEGVTKAHQLQPDLILLDIGLPSLSGIEVARQIRDMCVHTKILFVSEQRSPDIVQAALAAGGNGYVVKSDGQAELSKGVEAVCQGGFFLSKGVAHCGSAIAH